MSYRNNLKKDDRVIHAESKRVGTVKGNPREDAVEVGIVWQGCTAVQYVDIDKLRLVLDDKGTVDEVPPYDGEKPAHGPRSGPQAPRPSEAPTDPAVAALKAQRDAIAEEMSRMEDRFRVLKASREKLDRAIEVLTLPAHPS